MSNYYLMGAWETKGKPRSTGKRGNREILGKQAGDYQSDSTAWRCTNKKINPKSKHCTGALHLVPGLKIGAGMSRGIGAAAELEELGEREDRTTPALEQLWVITEGEEAVRGEK
jgi:hypothetical protein